MTNQLFLKTKKMNPACYSLIKLVKSMGVHAAHMNVQSLTILVLWNVCLATFHVQLTGGVF
jgi:hypothetical protein